MQARHHPNGWHPARHGPLATATRLAALAAFVAIGTHFAAMHEFRHQHLHHLDAVAYVLIVVGPAALFFRRRYPAIVLGVVFASVLVYTTLGYPDGPIFISLVIAFFGAVLAGRRRVAWIALAVGYPAILWLGALFDRRPAPTLGQAIGSAAWLLVLLSVAEVVRARRERAGDWRRMLEDEARHRATNERLRMARELHDVLAHNISLINVQAGVALHLMDERPEQARTALAAIKDASKETLQELRSVLGVLRQVDEDAPRSPAPGLGSLDELVGRAGATGLIVRTDTEGTPRALPGGVDLAAFRIVQEALTNVVRHAGARTATVRISYGGNDLTIRIDDDGSGARAPAEPGGSGIAGMRERATALGGELQAGPRPGGGFRVQARFPLDGAP